MKKIIFTIFIIHCLSILAYSQSSWLQIPSPTPVHLRSVYFVNNDTGYIGSDDNKIYKTLNGGNNWIFIGLVQYTHNTLKKLLFINENTGFILGGGIYRTTNSGMNWFLLSFMGGGDFCFVNSNIGYLTNGSSHVFKTTNSGFNWDTTGSLPHFMNGLYITTSYFLDINTGFAAGETVFWQGGPGVIYKTTNGGNNWILKYSSGGPYLSDNMFLAFHFLNVNIGYCCGDDGQVAKTTDGGESWVSVNIPPHPGYDPPNLTSIYILSQDTVYTCGPDGFFKTLNGGQNWSRVDLPIPNYVQVFFSGKRTGYIIGQNSSTQGVIYKTTNDGLTFVNKLKSEIPERFSLEQNYPNPFNPTTKIQYALPKNGFVKLVVFDAIGREIETLVNEKKTAGIYEATFNASQYSSGIYFYKLTADGFSETKKMLMIK